MGNLTKADQRYPSAFYAHSKSPWRMGCAAYVGRPFVTIDTLLENKPGGAWKSLDFEPDEAEQFALHILEKVKAVRAALNPAEQTGEA